MQKKHTHLFFDLDNTLWDFKKNSEVAMYSTFVHFNLKLQHIAFDQFFEVYSKNNHRLWADYRHKKVGKKELIRKRFQQTFDELGIAKTDPEQMNTFYLHEMPKQNILIEGALETLDYLKSKKYLMFIITNGFMEVQYKKLKNSGLSPFFQKVFISEDIKAPKPNYEIFEYAIKSANAPKTKSLMIGDDWESDILGALNFGIDAIYLNTENVHCSFSSLNNKSKLSQIKKMIQLKDFL
ncbi:MAG: YjjG family noncanonical pyrimidine nucleotidase [Prolixibacteraceae bacterium]|nr:YjjG family noncanonical pyrimidine nucleotidase [Prolixibacteraceae bacterium]